MPGATLSRWTMSYFAAACLMLVAGQGLMVAGYGYPSADVGAPETLVLVHLVAIGWLSLLMAGALLQFVPVLIGRAIVGGRFAAPALLLLLGGLGCLVGGFVALSGAIDLPLALLPVGGLLLLAGFGLFAAILAATLYAARPLPLPARFVATGLVALLGAALIGFAFTGALSGVVESPLLDRLVADGVELHAALGLGGWLSATAVGVSYRLFSMFLLAPEVERSTSRAAWWGASLAVGLVTTAVVFVMSGIFGGTLAFACALLLTLVAVALYGADILHIYRARKRKQAELNIRASFAALALFALSVLLLNVPALRTGNLVATVVYLFVFGWLTGLGLAQLYKIVAFLTWLEAYGPVLGRAPVPRVQDLVDERHAHILFRIYYGAVVVATLALAAGATGLFRVTVAAQLFATLCLMREFIRARRLSIVPAALRAPAGMVQPPLFLPPSVFQGDK
ncbi:hypothetical protein MUO32_13665 [Shinella sp. CPCC 101442]|uniref:hypothetical protein n=1 Tax=Shinella sp. CPCC 101442 TaxID=2932265 RepID=UPI0021531B28|nr:hypothetical protein [Shinella sp. CPCC 101442]MCR6500091.1 hypothetical protein [Shinella sp. CPCC 101442]